MKSFADLSIVKIIDKQFVQYGDVFKKLRNDFNAFVANQAVYSSINYTALMNLSAEQIISEAKDAEVESFDKDIRKLVRIAKSEYWQKYSRTVNSLSFIEFSEDGRKSILKRAEQVISRNAIDLIKKDLSPMVTDYIHKIN